VSRRSVHQRTNNAHQHTSPSPPRRQAARSSPPRQHSRLLLSVSTLGASTHIQRASTHLIIINVSSSVSQRGTSMHKQRALTQPYHPHRLLLGVSMFSAHQRTYNVQ
jgi:hypothetical protein